MHIKTLTRLMAGAALIIGAAPALAQTASAPRYGAFGLDTTAQKPSVKPGDDFWAYANGTWNDKVEIAADRASAGFGVQLTVEAEANVRAILDDMAKNPATYGASGKQVGDFYASWMDEAGIEARGTAPLKPYLARIAGVQDLAGLQVLFASTGYATPVDVDIIPDLADPTRYTAFVSQGGLGCRAIIICSRARNMTHSAPPIALISSRCRSWPASPMPLPKPMRSSRSKPPSPRSNGRPRKAGTSPS